jgi:DNA-binding transcriptional MerR regulator
VKYLRTSDVARAVGIHPNTVRRYVDWKLTPPVERSPAGYRRFTQRHLDCLRLARLVYAGSLPGRNIRQSGYHIVQRAVSGDLGGALELAHQHLGLILAERAHADAAAGLLERWAQGAILDAGDRSLQIGQVADLLGVTIDVLRNWERNGLIRVPRNPANGYRRYAPAQISRLRVIRTLSRAGYSLAAILRMLIQFDHGERDNLLQVLDTPRPDEDVYTAFDRWISTLNEGEQRARQAIVLLEEMLADEATRA